MNWKPLPVDERDFKLTECLEDDIKQLCAIFNYPYELLTSPIRPFNMSKFTERVDALKLLKDIEVNDKHGFLEGPINNWCNHRGLLLLSLSLTGKRDVYEFGAGDGSTKHLRNYCKANDRHFQSWENNKEWADKCGSIYVNDWNDDGLFWSAGVVFIDHAPGEQRVIAIAELAKRNETDIIVIHDTEEGGAGDYKFETIWHLFKYRLNYNRLGGGAGATAVSNTIDLNRFRGLSLGGYKFDDD